MLHLAIICIACAVSALNEGIAFIERKNNEFNTFWLSDEGKQNIAKVSFPRVYNVDVHNSSDCGGQKVTNRTSSSFYDYIINQYQSSRNNSCSIMENVSLKKLKNVQSNVDLAFRKRNLLWEKRKSSSTECTCTKKKEKHKKSKKKKHKVKLKTKKYRKKESKFEPFKCKIRMSNSGLSQQEKKLFLRLTNLKTSYSGHYPEENNLDIEKRMQKFCKKMELENQLKNEKLIETATSTFKEKPQKLEKIYPKNSKNSVLFVNKNLNELFSFRKNSFRNKHNNPVSNSDLFSVNFERRQNPAAEKTGYVSIHDTPKAVSGTLQNYQLRKNRRHLYSDFRDIKPTYNKNLFAKPYPYSANFKNKINFLYPNKKVVLRKKRKRRYMTKSALNLPQKEPKIWPFYKKFARHRSGLYSRRHKRHEDRKLTENNQVSSSIEADNKKKIEKTNQSNVKKSVLFKSEENISTEDTNFITVVTNPTHKYEEKVLFDETIEKPFLKKYHQSQMKESHNSMTDSPLVLRSSGIYHKYNRKYSGQSSNGELVPFSRYVKARHALRECLNCHILKDRKKRCGAKLCGGPRKCWRSAPLLCIPYIKKGQEDILRYLIQIMEKMLGKPLPSKKDIFGRTKYKPEKDSTSQSTCDDSYEDDYDNENVATTTKLGNESTGGGIGIRIESNNGQTMGMGATPGQNVGITIGPTGVPSPAGNNEANTPPSNEATIGLTIALTIVPTMRPGPGATVCAPNAGSRPCPNTGSFPGVNIKPCPGTNPIPCPGTNPAPCPGTNPIPCPGTNSGPCSGSNTGPCSGLNIGPRIITTPKPCTGPNKGQCLGSYAGSTVQSTPQIQRKAFTVSNINYGSSGLTTPYDSGSSICNPPNHLLVTSPMSNNTWITNTQLSIPNPTEISTQNINQFSAQSILGPPSLSATLTPYIVSGPSGFVAPSSGVSISGYAKPEKGKPSTDFYTTVSVTLNSEVTEPSTFGSTREGSFIPTLNPSSIDFSNTPAKQEDYFSFTPHSLGLPSEYSKSFHYSNLGSSTLPKSMLKIPNACEKSQLIDYDPIYEDFKNNYSFTQDTKWLPITNPSLISSTIKPFSFAFNNLKKKERNHNYDSSKFLSNRKGFQFDDYFFDENHVPDQDINMYFPGKKMLKMHQKKHLKQNLNLPATEYSLPFDYYLSEEYPLSKSYEVTKSGLKKNSRKVKKYHSHKDKYRKVKKRLQNQNSLARRKREDDYIWPEIYSDYFDESVYKDKSLQKRSESSSKIPDKNPSDQGWTPPFYDMFSELAKAVSELMVTESEMGKTTTAAATTTATTKSTTATTKSTTTTIKPATTTATTKSTTKSTTITTTITPTTTTIKTTRRTTTSTPAKTVPNIIPVVPVKSVTNTTTTMRTKAGTHNVTNATTAHTTVTTPMPKTANTTTTRPVTSLTNTTRNVTTSKAPALNMTVNTTPHPNANASVNATTKTPIIMGAGPLNTTKSNTTVTPAPSTKAVNSTSVHPNATTIHSNATTARPNATSAHPNATSIHSNATTARPNATSAHPNATSGHSNTTAQALVTNANATVNGTSTPPTNATAVTAAHIINATANSTTAHSNATAKALTHPTNATVNTTSAIPANGTASSTAFLTNVTTNNTNIPTNATSKVLSTTARPNNVTVNNTSTLSNNTSKPKGSVNATSTNSTANLINPASNATIVILVNNAPGNGTANSTVIGTAHLSNLTGNNTTVSLNITGPVRVPRSAIAITNNNVAFLVNGTANSTNSNFKMALISSSTNISNTYIANAPLKTTARPLNVTFNITIFSPFNGTVNNTFFSASLNTAVSFFNITANNTYVLATRLAAAVTNITSHLVNITANTTSTMGARLSAVAANFTDFIANATANTTGVLGARVPPVGALVAKGNNGSNTSHSITDAGAGAAGGSFGSNNPSVTIINSPKISGVAVATGSFVSNNSSNATIITSPKIAGAAVVAESFGLNTFINPAIITSSNLAAAVPIMKQHNVSNSNNANAAAVSAKKSHNVSNANAAAVPVGNIKPQNVSTSNNATAAAVPASNIKTRNASTSNNATAAAVPANNIKPHNVSNSPKNATAAVVNNPKLVPLKLKSTGSANQKTAFRKEKTVRENEKHSEKRIRNVSLLTNNEKKNSSENASPLRKTNIMGNKRGGKLMGTKNSDNLKSGKMSLFQTNSKGNLSDSENTSTEKPSKKDSAKEEKNGKGSQDFDIGDGQVPTTMKTAVIVKGTKKLLTKPSPKIFPRVYPDSFDFEAETNENISTTTLATSNSSTENKTALLSSTLKPDIRLQLLAVCEGYLEIIRRIKALNQSCGENLDAELAQYCESIISQSFNTQLEKPRKIELNEPSPFKNNNGNAAEEGETNAKFTNKVNLSALQDINENDKEFSDSQVREKPVDDAMSHPEKANEIVDVKKEAKNLKQERNLTETGNSGSKKKKKIKRKKPCKKSLAKQETEQKIDGTEDGILKKGISEEQIKLIKLLKKRKRALMSWLMNSKDQYKSDDFPETEYFDDEDFIPPESDFSEYSGTIKPKRNDNNFKKTTQLVNNSTSTLYPIYAKHYGYDKQGELREVEVLWRKVNEKTHEQKILKNMSVIAFFLTSTIIPNENQEESRLLLHKEDEGDVFSDTELKAESRPDFSSETSLSSEKTTSSEHQKHKITIPFLKSAFSTAKSQDSKTTVLPKKNETRTYISKPDPSSIVGVPPNGNKTHPNNTRKASHKYGAAKDFVQEYSIEFLNYAVYILPAMFTILFFFCCFGCALYILKTRKSFRKVKKKKKRTTCSSDDTSDSSDESDDSHSKRKRENKRKKKSYKDVEEDDNNEKKTKKKFWNVLKMPSSSYKELNEDNNQNERKSFLKFLKGKKEENKTNVNKFSKNYPDSGDEEAYGSDQSGAGGSGGKKEVLKGDANSEAVERRELISLLEELKKIELEQTGEKKEVKSVQVQYAVQEDENPFCQRPEFSYPYEKNVFGLPKGYFFCSKKFPNQQANTPVINNWDLYGDVSEMTELLPCECSYFSKKNDYFRHFRLNQEGECKRIYKIYRDSGVNQTPFKGKNFLGNKSENQSFIYNEYRNINSDTSEEFIGVTKKNAGTEVRLTESANPFRFLFKKNTGLMEEMGNMKHHHLSKKKYVRLKDDGVLCRL